MTVSITKVAEFRKAMAHIRRQEILSTVASRLKVGEGEQQMTLEFTHNIGAPG